MTLKHKELNEQNCANWSNGESNIAIEKHNCLLCSELVDRKLCKLESDYLSPLLGSDFVRIIVFYLLLKYQFCNKFIFVGF